MTNRKPRKALTEKQLINELLIFQQDAKELHDDLRQFSGEVHLLPALQPQVQACYRALNLAHEHITAAITLASSCNQADQ